MPEFSVCLYLADPALKRRFLRIIENCAWPSTAPDAISGLKEDLGSCGRLLLLTDCRDVLSPGFLEARQAAGRKTALILVASASYGPKELAAALDAGADDFVYASTDETVLAAKLHAYIRRLLPGTPGQDARASKTGLFRLEGGRLVINPGKAGKTRYSTPLTPTEIKILRILIQYSDLIVDRSQIMEGVWGAKAGEVNAENVDKHVESIRRKLRSSANRLKTVYGVGYILYG